jgi:hypothetical protein
MINCETSGMEKHNLKNERNVQMALIGDGGDYYEQVECDVGVILDICCWSRIRVQVR